MKRSLCRISGFGIAAIVLTAGLSVMFAQQQQIRTAKQMPFPKNPDWSKLELDVLKVQGQVHLIAGAGGNIAVQTGDDSILLVDTGYAQMALAASMGFATVRLQSSVCSVKSISPDPAIMPRAVCMLKD